MICSQRLPLAERHGLTVENTGETLTPQAVSTLAEPFQRGTERMSTDHAGVGLGLAIAKSITQAHEGTLILTPGLLGALRHGAATVCAIAHERMTIRRAARGWSAVSQTAWMPANAVA